MLQRSEPEYLSEEVEDEEDDQCNEDAGHGDDTYELSALLRTFHKIEEMSRRKGVQDPLQFYIEEASKTPLLTADEEKELVLQMTEARAQWRKLLFMNNTVTNHVLAEYANILAGERNITRATLISPGKDIADITTNTLQESFPKMGKLVKRMHRLSAEIADGYENQDHPNSVHERTSELKEVRSKLYELLEQVPLSHAHMQKWHRELQDVTVPDDADPESAIAFVREHGMYPHEFKEHLQRTADAFNQWKEVKDHLILSNLRLVISIAAKYTGNRNTMADLIQEGNCGLMHGIDKLDPERTNKVSTYVVWWIHQAIKKYRKSGAMGPLRVPEHMFALRSEIDRIENGYRAQDMPPPDDTTIAHLLDVSIDSVTNARIAIPRSLSLNESLFEDGDHLSSTLEDSRSDSPSEASIASEVNSAIHRALRTLTDTERHIINEFFGLGRVEERTESGITFKIDEEKYADSTTLGNVQVLSDNAGCTKSKSVSRERVRQLKDKALTRLKDVRHPYREALLHIAREMGGDASSTVEAMPPLRQQEEYPLPVGIDHEHPSLNMAISELNGISTAIRNTLERMKIFTVRDLVCWTDAMFESAWPPLRKKSITWIDNALSALNLYRKGTDHEHAAIHATDSA